MPTLTNYTWRRTESTVEEFADIEGPPQLGVVPFRKVKQVITIQSATIVDAPQMPDPRNVVHTAPWVPTMVIVKDAPMAGSARGPRRSVRIAGHHLKKDGTVGKIAQGANWMHMGEYTGRGTLHAMPDWVRELVDQMEPADEGVLT